MQCYKFYYDTLFRYKLPSWAMFELGKAPVFWKTMNGLPPTAVSVTAQCRVHLIESYSPLIKYLYTFLQGEKLRLFYNPAATQLTPNEEFGVAFNGNFDDPTNIWPRVYTKHSKT